MHHYYIQKPALPYVSYSSIVGAEPQILSGKNLLTSAKGYLQPRPGVSAVGSAFSGGTIQRVFTWQRWDGAYFILASVLQGGKATAYKMQVGVDANFVPIWGPTSNSSPFDFVVANNRVYFSTGDFIWWYGGNATEVHPVGIDNPMKWNNLAPELRVVSIPEDLEPPQPYFEAVNGGYQYVVAYGNSTTGSLSDICRASGYTGNFGHSQVTIKVGRTPDLQCDELHVYRTTDGGGGVYFELPNSPFPHTPGEGFMTVTDYYRDEYLSIIRAPMPGINVDPGDNPPIGLVWYANRVWGFKDNTLYWSGWEEVENGVPEECWPDANLWPFPSKIYALASIQECLLIFTSRGIWKITGDTQETFRREILFATYGVLSSQNVTVLGKTCAWFDVSNTIHITDGNGEKDVSTQIYPDLAGTQHGSSSLSFHVSGEYKWLVFGNGVKLFILDLNTGNWLPPWTIPGTCLFSGETANGTVDLLIGVGGTVAKLDPSVYTDLGSAYDAPTLVTNLFELSDPHKVGEMEYVGLEQIGTPPEYVGQLTDDDPNQKAFTDITANRENTPYRTQGTYLTDHWYWSRSPAAKRIALKLTWPSFNGTNYPFKLLSIDLAFKLPETQE